MRLHHFALIGLAAASLMVGCSHKPATTQQVQNIRQTYHTIDPQAKVGVVVATLPEKGLIAVGDLPVAEFKEGDVLVLMTPKQQIIGAGHVVAKTADALHLSYDVNEKARAPKVGDLAVKAQKTF